MIKRDEFNNSTVNRWIALAAGGVTLFLAAVVIYQVAEIFRAMFP